MVLSPFIHAPGLLDVFMLEACLEFIGASQALIKAGDIATPLEPHQQRVISNAQHNNMLIAHGMGSGKTLSALAAADKLGKPVEVFTPASLTKNFEKEINKHRGENFVPYKIHSISSAASQGRQVEPGSTVIVDEAHLARTPGTMRSKYLKDQLQRAGRVLMLTGTPTYNQPENIAPLVNMVSQQNVLPEDPSAFKSRFIEEKKVEPGFIARWMGVKPGIVKQLKNKQDLVEALRGKVDTFEQQKDMPARIEKDVEVEMGDKQMQVYRYLEDQLPWITRYKIRGNLPPTKSESKDLNAFSAGLRQASNTPGPYIQGMDHLQAAMESPKMLTAFGSIKEKMSKDPNFRGFVYSNYMDAGMLPMASLLRRDGIPYAIYHGGLTPNEKQQIVNNYNSGKIKVLLGSSAASEGLDLKGTKLIQVLEPHFNEAKTEQAIARGIRFGSHGHLPEIERKVMVERYYSKPKQGFFSKLISGEDAGIDRYLRQRALEKKQLMDQIHSALEEAQR